MNLDDLSLDQLQALYAQKTDPHVAAIHQIESGGAAATANPVNPASGASGSMQTMAATARDPGYGVKPSNGSPVDNTRTGVEYYQALRDKYGDPVKAAVAYDWGPGNADKWIANGAHLDDLPLETLQYVQKFQQKTGGSKNAAPTAQAAQPALPQPTTTEMNIVAEPAADTPEYTRMGRIEQGVMDTLGGGGRAALKGLGWLLGKAGDTQGAQSMNDTVQQAEEAQAARDREFALKAQLSGAQPGGTDWYRVGGRMIPAFLMPSANPTSVLGAAAEGAVQGAVTGAADTPPGESYGQHAAAGAAFGGAGGAAVNALGRLFRGAQLRPDVQELVDRGITPTPGMTLGGPANTIEQRATSWPIVGDYFARGRQGSVQDMNQALYREVLDPIGGNIPARTASVREATDQIGDQLSSAYRQLLPHLSFAPDQQYTAAMQNVLTNQARLPQAMRDDFDHIMENYFRNQTVTGPNGVQILTGDALKDAETALGQRARQYGANPDPFYQDMAGYLRDTRTALRDAIERQNPQYANQLQAINQAYARFSVLRNASQRVGDTERPIMPGQLQAAVKAKDKSVEKNAFSRGNALLQDLSDPALAVLGAKVPDSGTAGRLMTGSLFGGLGLGYLTNPAVGAALLGTSLGYATDSGRRAMFALMARRPDLARAIGDAMVQNAGRAGGAAGVLSGNMGQ